MVRLLDIREADGWRDVVAGCRESIGIYDGQGKWISYYPPTAPRGRLLFSSTCTTCSSDKHEAGVCFNQRLTALAWFLNLMVLIEMCWHGEYQMWHWKVSGRHIAELLSQLTEQRKKNDTLHLCYINCKPRPLHLIVWMKQILFLPLGWQSCSGESWKGFKNCLAKRMWMCRKTLYSCVLLLQSYFPWFEPGFSVR